MQEYTITANLLNGTKQVLKVMTNSIMHTIKEVEDTYDSIGMPIEEITYERR